MGGEGGGGGACNIGFISQQVNSNWGRNVNRVACVDPRCPAFIHRRG